MFPPDLIIGNRSFRPPIEKWVNNSFKFGEDCTYPNEKGAPVRWGLHLGADMNGPPGTPVRPIAPGRCLYIGTHPGVSKDERNWGGIVILRHFVRRPEWDTVYRLYSLYGHLYGFSHSPGADVFADDIIGRIACPLTPENGWWEDAHLHLGIMTDPFKKYPGGIVRGYATEKPPLRLNDWVDPDVFFTDPLAAIIAAEQEFIRSVDKRGKDS